MLSSGGEGLKGKMQDVHVYTVLVPTCVMRVQCVNSMVLENRKSNALINH